MNSKIKILLDEIINDSSTDKSLSTIPQASPKNIISQKKKVTPFTPPTEVVAAVFQEKPQIIIDEIMLPRVKSKPRTKADIIGFSDGDDNSDDDSESIDIYRY